MSTILINQESVNRANRFSLHELGRNEMRLLILALQGTGANSHTKIKPLYDVYTTYLPSQVSRELTKRIAAAKNEITRPVGRVSGLVDVVFVVQ